MLPKLSDFNPPPLAACLSWQADKRSGWQAMEEDYPKGFSGAI